jgi:hypothetical protein
MAREECMYMADSGDDMCVRAADQSSPRCPQTSSSPVIGPLAQWRAVGDLDRVESQTSGELAETEDREAGMRPDSQTTPVVDALYSLSSALARRHIVFYEEC